MAKTKIYYGCDAIDNHIMYATVTGQMADGSFVYTEIAQNQDGSIAIENGEPKLLLDNQYLRMLKHGCQTFHRI